MSAEKKIKILNIAFSSTYISHYTEHAIFFFLVCQISGLFHIYFVYHITIFFVSQDTCITMKLILNTSQSITILYSPHAVYTCIHWHYGLSQHAWSSSIYWLEHYIWVTIGALLRFCILYAVHQVIISQMSTKCSFSYQQKKFRCVHYLEQYSCSCVYFNCFTT